MECGTLNKSEALCGDIDLLPFHSGMRVPTACCMCGGRLVPFFNRNANAGDVTNSSGFGCVVAYTFFCLKCSVCRGEEGREVHIPLHFTLFNFPEEFTPVAQPNISDQILIGLICFNIWCFYCW